MIKIEKIDVWGFEHAIRGMRNPMNSWDKSDSFGNGKIFADDKTCMEVIGKNDMGLMVKLYNAGPEHRKYLRQIFVSMDITAPLYWWKEFDTYKVGTVANSCSTMHKISSKEFELDDFSHEHLDDHCILWLEGIIDLLNGYRERYNGSKNKNYWWQLIQMLPSSYNQKRTVTMNYENIVSMIHQRSGHKLDEWNDLIHEFYKLPYIYSLKRSSWNVGKLDANTYI